MWNSGDVSVAGVAFGYTRCDRCVAELYFWTLLVTVNYRPVTVPLGSPCSHQLGAAASEQPLGRS